MRRITLSVLGIFAAASLCGCSMRSMGTAKNPAPTPTPTPQVTVSPTDGGIIDDAGNAAGEIIDGAGEVTEKAGEAVGEAAKDIGNAAKNGAS